MSSSTRRIVNDSTQGPVKVPSSLIPHIDCPRSGGYWSTTQYLGRTFFLVLAIAVPDVAAVDNPWSRQAAPTGGTSQSIGKYTAGCVLGARALSDSETGLITMRPQRRRNYGHSELVVLVRALGKHMRDAGLGTVLVGDLGMPRGGPTLSNHVSHQSGLDVDIWFDLLRPGKQLSPSERRSRPASSYVNWGRKKLDPRFGEGQVELIRWSAQQPSVQRIFVSAVIKRHLCQTVTGHRKWLAKVRPWWGHADHLHVRLRCPPDDFNCVPQSPVPPGDGCGEELNWWLTRADADRAARRKQAKPRPRGLPELPSACALVLTAP